MSTENRMSPLVSRLGFDGDCGNRDGCVTAATYSSLEEEYHCVRSSVGLSDLNHYGKIKVSGESAQDLVNYFSLSDVARLPISQSQSTFLLEADGKPLCEALIGNYGDHFLILSEGIQPSLLVDQLKSCAATLYPDAQVSDQTDSIGLLGLDGPFSWELLKSFMGIGVIGTRYLEIVSDQSLDDIDFTLARAGKSGEYGYLIWTNIDKVTTLWDRIVAIGEAFDLRPLGYQVLDLCKLENRFPNHRREGRCVSNVLELNTRVMFSPDKDQHLGREAIEDLIATNVKQRVIGVQFSKDHALNEEPKVGASVFCDDHELGQLVSTGYSYTLNCWIGLALVDTDYAYVGLDYTVRSTEGEQAAKAVSAPFIFNRSMEIRPQEDSYLM